MILLKNLNKSFDKNVLNDINVEIPDGSIVGLIGMNGTGKSTLLRLLSGIYDPDSGQIFYDGEDFVKNPTLKEHIFFLSDDPNYKKNVSAYGLILSYQRLYPNKYSFISFMKYLTDFNIPVDKPLYAYSKGLRRQTFLAFALALSPKYLYLDEAFDGVDPKARILLKKELLRLQEKNNMTVIISSHSLRELTDICDSYLIINNGDAKLINDLSTLGYHRYTMVFDKEMKEENFDFSFASFKAEGKIINCITGLDYDSMYLAIKHLNPKILEEQEMTFEEKVITNIQDEVTE